VNRRLLLGLLAILCAACRQDMQQQPKYTPLKRSGFYPDGRSARPIPPGTIATDEVNDNSPVTTGSDNRGFLTTIPIPVTAALLERGRDRYNIYCSPCHAETGYGNGMITRRGYQSPANLHRDSVRNAPPGYLFAVISNGYGAMPDYSYQIKKARDRWAIIAYIRALELSRSAPIAGLDAQDRARLEAAR